MRAVYLKYAASIRARIDRPRNNRLPIIDTCRRKPRASASCPPMSCRHMRAPRELCCIVSPGIMHSFCAREEKGESTRSHDQSTRPPTEKSLTPVRIYSSAPRIAPKKREKGEEKEKRKRWKEMRWEEMRWDEMRWEEERREEMRWDEMRGEEKKEELLHRAKLETDAKGRLFL